MTAAVGRGGEMPTIALGSTAQNPQERKQNENTLSEIWVLSSNTKALQQLHDRAKS